MAPRRLRFDFDLRERRRRRLPKATKNGVGARPPCPALKILTFIPWHGSPYSSVGVHSLKIEYYGNQFPLNGPTERRQLRRSCTVRSTASGHSYRKNRKYRKPYCLFIGKEYRLCKQRRDSSFKTRGRSSSCSSFNALIRFRFYSLLLWHLFFNNVSVPGRPPVLSVSASEVSPVALHSFK